MYFLLIQQMKNLLFTFSYKLKNVLNAVGSLGSVGA